MVDLSVSVEGAIGLDWPQWIRLVDTIEDLGFAGHYISDHMIIFWEGFDQPSLDMVVALTYLAEHTERVRFGPMVAPLSFRPPVMLARQAAALDVLSDGRMILGVGTGWMEREHEVFGFDLGDMATRFERLEEGLEVISRLLRTDKPTNYDGRFYQLRNAVLPPPRLSSGSPPIMIGGSGPTRTLPLVARFADIWNAQTLTAPEHRERSALLDTLIVQAGRKPENVIRTQTLPIFCWTTPDELEARLRWTRRFPPWRDLSVEQVLEDLRNWKGLIGTPDEVVEQIREYEAAGVRELILQWYDSSDIEGLEMIAFEILPRIASPVA
jgi:alkanesulfonate monooxygenase SsuD/methylene tetrahydromethanopterin reductase-like flavin-dependent oxidoreductase (luciferase family)